MRLIAAIAAFVALAAPASAADFTVNATTDTHDQATGDGQCKDASGKCTLRAAVEQANALAGADTVTVPAGTYTLTVNESLTITSDVTIKGAGARTTVIDGSEFYAALLVNTAAAHATLSGLAVTSATSGVDVRNGAFLDGTGIVIRDNLFPGGGSSTPTAGLFVSGASVTLRDSAILDNVGGSSPPILGGGVYSGGGTVALIRTTVAGNRAENATAQGLGGGIFKTGGSMTLDHVTLVRNSAPKGMGGNLYTIDGAATVEDSIIADGSAMADANCGGTAPITKGRNLAGDASCGFGAGQLVADPLLGAVADHGGTTDTLLPGPGSPAVDAAAKCDTPDQRGAPAPVGAGCDIGAVEIGAGRSVTLQASAGEVAPGGAVTLIATATNAGLDDSQGTTVGFDLPAGASADLINSPTGMCAGTTCSFGALPRGAMVTVTLALRLPATPGPATTVARVSGATPDPTAADDTASVTTTVTGPAQTPTPSPSPSPTPTPDTKKPVLSKVRLVSHRRKLAFTVSEAATVRIGIRRRGKAAGTITKRLTAGAHRVRLRRGGRLRLTVTATDAAGNRSPAKRLKVRARK